MSTLVIHTARSALTLQEEIEEATVALISDIMSATSPEKIDQFSQVLAQYPQEEIETTHYDEVKGIYIRKVLMKAGQIGIGRVHKKEHYAIIAAGEFNVSTGDGTNVNYKAGDVFFSAAGTQRIVTALVDSVFVTIHRTDAETPEARTEELAESPRFNFFDFDNKLKDPQLAHKNKKELE